MSTYITRIAKKISTYAKASSDYKKIEKRIRIEKEVNVKLHVKILLEKKKIN